MDNFHNFALFAQKNQEIFTRINAEKTYQEHCKSLSSLNTTLYRETPLHSVPTSTTITPIPEPRITIPSPTVRVNAATVVANPPLPSVPHHFEVASTEDITIFAYSDVKLGQVIKDNELLKLILRALQWEHHGNVQSQAQQLECLRNTSFRAVMTNPLLLQDEDLVQLLGPYLSKDAYGPPPSAKVSTQQVVDASGVTEMEVGIDPSLFFPYDDDDTKTNDGEDMRPAPITKTKRPRNIVPKKRTPKTKTGLSALPQLPHAAAVDVVLDATKHKLPEVTILPEPMTIPAPKPIIPPPVISDVHRKKPKIDLNSDDSSEKQLIRVRILPLEKRKEQQPQLVQRILQKSKQQSTTTTPAEKPGRKNSKHVSFAEDVVVSSTTPTTAAAVVATIPSPVPTPIPAPKPTQTPVPVVAPAPVIVASTTTTTPSASVPPPAPAPAPVVTVDAVAAAVAASPPPVVVTAPVAPTPTPNVATPVTTRKTKAKAKTVTNAATSSTPNIPVATPATTRSATKAKPFKCQVCSKKYTTKGNLTAHMKTHKGKGKFTCDKCGRM